MVLTESMENRIRIQNQREFGCIVQIGGFFKVTQTSQKIVMYLKPTVTDLLTWKFYSKH